jgi:DNA-binding transcriptional regulator YhcF (GntR family)
MLEIKIDTDSPIPFYQQIVEQMKYLIDSGLLKSGAQIPSVRDLASWLQLNPSTVARAYYDLKQEGLVVTSRRRGTIIVENKNKERQIKNRVDRTDNNRFLDKLSCNSSPVDIETAFTLQPSYWRVQRPG